jgi:MFS family permease
MQEVLGFSPLKTGLAFLPITLIIGVGSGITAGLVTHIGYKLPMVIGPLITAVGLILLAQTRVNGTYWHDIFPGLTTTAFGIGLSFVAITIVATSGLSAKFSGLGSGLLNTSQQIGGALGLALLSGIASKHSAEYTKHHSHVLGLVFKAQIAGYRDALYADACLIALAAVIALLAIRQRKGEKVAFDPNAAMGA